MDDRYGNELLIGDRVTAFGWRGGHGVVNRFGTRYVYVTLTTAAFEDHDGTTETFDPEDLQSGWHGVPRNQDKMLTAVDGFVADTLGFAVDDKIITVGQAQEIMAHLHDRRSRFDSPTIQSGVLSTEPASIPAR